jgi:Domain of unknown function (DUF4123)
MGHSDLGATSIDERLVGLAKPHAHLYALVDLANVASEAPKLRRWFKTTNALCVFGDPSPAAELASPWLISLRSEPGSAKARRKIIELAKRSSAVTWMVSELTASDLAQRLRVRTEARLPDRYDILLRHFDPRVLPVLYRTLEACQRDAFFSLGCAWLYLDRAASITELRLTPAPAIDGFSAPIDLNEQQTATLLDASEIDAVMPELVKEEPDRFLALGNGPARYRFTEQCLNRARHWKLDQFPQKVVFCALSLRLGPDFDQAPNWQQALGSVAASGVRLSEAIEHALSPAAP